MSRAIFESLEARQLLSTYYISPSGSDSYAGTSTDKPWKTLARANLQQFNGGDAIALKGSNTFYGKLYLTTDDHGSSTTPITIRSYGTGRATINGGAGSAFYAYNTAGVSISNLNFVGSGAGSNTSTGVMFYTDSASGTKYDYVHINAVDVSGFNYGISVGGGNGSSGFRDIQVTSSSLHDNARAGFFSFGPVVAGANEKIYLAHVHAYNNIGIASDLGVTGHGILIGSAKNATVERCVANNNGSVGNGGAGIWAYDSTKVIFQYNESYANKTGGPHDGDGFDFDQNTSYSVMQYNYSHENDGAGFLMATKYNNSTHGHNTVRYNISQNDCRKLNYGSLHMWGRSTSDEWYNNTVYLTPKSGSTTYRYGIKIVNDSIPSNCTSYVHFRNNIIQTTGGMPMIFLSSDQLAGSLDLKFQGNAYYSTGSTFRVMWGSSTYNTLSNWRTAKGEEMLNGHGVGFSGNPLLNGAGTGQTFGNADLLSNLTAYKLQSTSPLINSALNLYTNFGISAGSRDFWGTALPQGSGFDFGADEV